MRDAEVHPEFWKSPAITKLDVRERLLLLGLPALVDDNGDGLDSPADIAAKFPHDVARGPVVTISTVSAGMRHLEAAGLITRTPSQGTFSVVDQGWPRDDEELA